MVQTLFQKILAGFVHGGKNPWLAIGIAVSSLP